MENTAPAYMRIRQYVIDLVLQAGEKKVKILSERELCKLFGVTRPTVRRSLEDLIEGEYLIASPGKGTFTNPEKFAIHSASNNAVSIGFLVGDGKVIYHYGYSVGLMAGILKKTYDMGVSFRSVQLLNSGDMVLEELLHLRIDTLVWAFPPPEYTEVLKKLQRNNVSVVTINREPDKILSSVSINFEATGAFAANWFLERGMSEIVFAARQKNLPQSDAIFRGFHKAFSNQGKEYNTRLALSIHNDTLAGLKKNEVVTDLRKMLEFGLPIDGIYANGAFIFHTMEAFRMQEEEFPGKLTVLGHNSFNREAGEFLYPVIEDPIDTVGARAVEIAAGLVRKEIKQPVHERITPVSVLQPKEKSTV